MTELLAVEDLQKYFPVTRGPDLPERGRQVKAVDGVNFTLEQGETLGVVGESGLRQVDDGALHRTPPRADWGERSSSKAVTSPTSTAATCGRSGGT
jgi:hypothetical protein